MQADSPACNLLQVKRIYGVYESVLASDKRTWLIKEEFTLADIITIPYLTLAGIAGTAPPSF